VWLQLVIGGQVVGCPARRESLIVVIAAVSLFIGPALFAEPVDLSQARKAADAFLKMRVARPDGTRGSVSATSEGGISGIKLTAAGTREIRGDDGAVLAYVTDLKGGGFVAMSAETDIVPVIAYSFRSPFPAEQDERNPLYRMLREDIRLRILALAEHPEIKTAETDRLWNSYVSMQADGVAEQPFQQWPPEGTTSTGGWLETAWQQGAPYNKLCPLDPVDRSRSYVGCAATALAQLLNYHKRCIADFDDADSYASYSGMRIDADSALYDFPSFVKLNEYLDTVRAKYSQEIELDDTDIAALSFACGVATGMDYSSLGSGAAPTTVRDALLDKLGFHSADVFGGLSPDSSRVLQESVINQLPALVGMCPPDGIAGHLVVCDGYNTNDEYHLNFGWGADHPDKVTEAWYRLPKDLLSHANVISETILNIQPDKPALEVDPASMSFYSAPGEESAPRSLRLMNNVVGVKVSSVTSPDGFLIARSENKYFSRLDSFTMQQVGMRATISIKFRPEQAGGYHGILTIEYGDGRTRYVILRGWSYAGGTRIAVGNVSGVWSQAQSPYFVTGDIQVPEAAKLEIEPGVKVFFMGPYSLTVGRNARLAARGNAARPVEFTAWNRECGWTGLRFVNSGNDDLLSHCSITFAKKGAGSIPQGKSTAGAPADNNGGAIYCSSSNPTIENCKITNNVGDVGGAVYCVGSSPVISNTLIANNASAGGRPRCGGICCAQVGVPELRNCTIVHNSPGGIVATSWDGTNVTNTIVWGNDVYQIQTDECSPAVSFCDVQGGYHGEGNIDVDPCFFEPSDGVGIDYDDSSANWALRTCSPCINSGTQIAELPPTDLAGASRTYSDIIDVGAYENQSSLPLVTVSPSANVDAGFVRVAESAFVQVNIVNTGTRDFKIEGLSVADANGVFSLLTTVQNRILSPGDSVPVKIAFSPREEKSYTSTLDVRSTADNGRHREIALRGVGVSGTIIPGPTVSGIWTKAESPYVITGDIRIPRGQRLLINPGVVVKFAGRFGLTVGYKASLRAIGADPDRILFTPTDTEEGWFGIRFVNSGADDTLENCTIECSKKPATGGGGLFELFGGGILCCGSEEDEPGFSIPSSPTINSCVFRHNHARTGGAIMCTDDSEAIIINNTIVENSAELDGAAIALYYAYCTIANNVIAHNSADAVGGGIVNYLGCPSIINNTIVHNRPSALHLEMTSPYASTFSDVVNNIVWDNEVFLSDSVEAWEYEVQYNDIQGGWPGTGNIDVDPLFADTAAGDYHLKSQAGRWDSATQSWVSDSVTSPCIDAGDPSSDVADEPQPNGQRIDMGAYGGTDQAGKSSGI
jgi:hypothetical protein